MPWFFCPTQVFLEPGALKNNASTLNGLGKRCFVVTGKTSAAASGVLGDLADLLPSLGVEYEVFSDVEPNPSIHTCREGGRRAMAFGADYIIGAGGGSALDAAKAVAFFAANDAEPMAIYDPPPIPPLRVVAIPTTAGTGSEVNGFAILTLPEIGFKRTYSSPAAFPVLAFIDPHYTASLPYAQTIGTALDAFSHCAESYFSPRATSLTIALGIKGTELVWRALQAVTSGDASEAVRMDLLTGAMLGGICIAHAGTGYPHPLGYNLSLYHDIPHGTACAVFEGGYLQRQAAAAPALYDRFLRGAALPDDIGDKLTALAGPMPRLTAEDIARYAKLASGAKNYANSHAPLESDEATVAGLYKEVFGV